MQLQLTTVGRNSGRRRRTVVDVVHHDKRTDTYYVVSVWGEDADWYKNLRANPNVEVLVRWRHFSARTTDVPREQAEELIADFWRRHTPYVRAMFRLIGVSVKTEREMRAAAAEMRVLAIQPRKA